MKAVIIGGGIAGLTQGLLLQDLGYEVVICERTPKPDHRGHAFLMNEDGLSLLKPYIKRTLEKLKSNRIDLFSLKDPSDEELIKIKLNGWFCLKRVDLISFLISLFDPHTIKFNCEFDHFEYDHDKATAVVFKNGKKEKGDIFIGADGGASAIRTSLFGDTKYTPIEVKEIVGISSYTKSSEYQFFEKIQSSDGGLAFGFIPTTDNQSVWFMQYDVGLEPSVDLSNPTHLKSFCFDLLQDFPLEAKEVLNANDFSTSYIWNTRDFDLLPSFHKKNVVLIGDAAHLTLPFISAGTTNAILDASILAESLSEEMELDLAFKKYYDNRSPHLRNQIEQGRELKKIFLDPKKYSARGFILPLFSDKYSRKKDLAPKPLVISYFTDPICSTCWIFQPLLRKLELEYGHFVDIQYHMGGLLPSWEKYSKGAISEPADAARLWNDLADQHNMPLDGDIWIEDPLDSSYPPSIAFKAAQLQDSDKAISFLRRIKEMLFIEKKNINKWVYLEKAALTSGLDTALLIKDIAGKGHERFLEDLKHAQELGIHVFPTLIFKVDGFPRRSLSGNQPYERLEKYILKDFPLANKKAITLSIEELFQRFNQLTSQEINFILEINELKIKAELKRLELNGIIHQFNIKNATYWQLNFL